MFSPSSFFYEGIEMKKIQLGALFVGVVLVVSLDAVLARDTFPTEMFGRGLLAALVPGGKLGQGLEFKVTCGGDASVYRTCKRDVSAAAGNNHTCTQAQSSKRQRRVPAPLRLTALGMVESKEGSTGCRYPTPSPSPRGEQDCPEPSPSPSPKRSPGDERDNSGQPLSPYGDKAFTFHEFGSPTED